jgi:hypothetical protein
MGAILTPGRRTVSSALRAVGLCQQKQFHRYQRVLSHASWSSVKASRVLLGLLWWMFAHQQMRQATGALRRQAGWYHKAHPTFADALGLVRKEGFGPKRTLFTGRPRTPRR